MQPQKIKQGVFEGGSPTRYGSVSKTERIIRTGPTVTANGVSKHKCLARSSISGAEVRSIICGDLRIFWST